MTPLGDKPSKHGALLGAVLAALAAAGRKDAPIEFPDCCLSCAFRPGTMPNKMAGTGKTALDCVLGIDPDRFGCHHGMKEGQPQKLCVGYIAAILAPFSFTKELLNILKEEIDGLSGDDEVRAAFDAWLATADPEGKLDVYQLGRLYGVQP